MVGIIMWLSEANNLFWTSTWTCKQARVQTDRRKEPALPYRETRYYTIISAARPLFIYLDLTYYY